MYNKHHTRGTQEPNTPFILAVQTAVLCCYNRKHEYLYSKKAEVNVSNVISLNKRIINTDMIDRR